MDFGKALKWLKAGSKVCREGWNGKGMFIELVDGVTPEHLPYIQMKTVDDKFVPWLVSQTDVLADDWQVI